MAWDHEELILGGCPTLSQGSIGISWDFSPSWLWLCWLGRQQCTGVEEEEEGPSLLSGGWLGWLGSLAVGLQQQQQEACLGQY